MQIVLAVPKHLLLMPSLTQAKIHSYPVCCIPSATGYAAAISSRHLQLSLVLCLQANTMLANMPGSLPASAFGLCFNGLTRASLKRIEAQFYNSRCHLHTDKLEPLLAATSSLTPPSHPDTSGDTTLYMHPVNHVYQRRLVFLEQSLVLLLEL